MRRRYSTRSRSRSRSNGFDRGRDRDRDSSRSRSRSREMVRRRSGEDVERVKNRGVGSRRVSGGSRDCEVRSHDRRHSRRRSRSRSSSSSSDRKKLSKRSRKENDSDPFQRMSQSEYQKLTSSVTTLEAAESKEILRDVDITSAESLEMATAQRAVREIKKCADEEVKLYIRSSEFQVMVENLKRRERERLLRELIYEQDQQRKELEDRQFADAERLREIHRRKELQVWWIHV